MKSIIAMTLGMVAMLICYLQGIDHKGIFALTAFAAMYLNS